MGIQLVKHKTLEKLRDELKVKDFEKFLKYKAKRYGLFRVQNFLNGGTVPDPEHMEIAKSYECDVKSLGGVKAFAIEWDIHPKTGKVIRRDKSVWQAHEEFMLRAAVNLSAIDSGECLPKRAH